MKRTLLGLGLIGSSFALRWVWSSVDNWLDKQDQERLDRAARAAEAHEWMQRQIEREFWWHALGWAGFFVGSIVLVVNVHWLLTGGFEGIVSTLEGLR